MTVQFTRLGASATSQSVSVGQISGGMSVFNPTAAYLAANVETGPTPAYFIQFDGHPTRFGSHAEMRFPDMEYRMTRIPSQLQAQIEPDEGFASFGASVIHLADGSGAITSIIRKLSGSFCSLRTGFLGLDESDYASYPLGLVDRAAFDEGRMEWSISVRDPYKLTDRTVFSTARTTLAAPLGPRDTIARVRMNQYFEPDGGVFRIGSECIRYTGKGSANRLVGLTRGAFGTHTPPEGHLEGSLVEEGLYKEGHPMDLALSVLLSSGKHGLSIPSGFVNVPSFVRAKNRLNPNLQFRFIIWGGVNAYQWLTSEIYSPCMSYPIPDNAGRIAVQQLRFPTTLDTVAHLSQSTNITGIVSQAEINYDTLFNAVRIQYDPDPVTGEFRETSGEITDPESIGVIKKKRVKLLKVSGMRRGAPGTRRHILRIARHVLRRHRFGVPRVRLRLKRTQHVRVPGEIVLLTHDRIPDCIAGTMGIANQYWEIVSRSTDFVGGAVEVELAYTGIDAPNKVISALTGGYDAASEDEKARYAFIGVGDTIGG